MELLVGFHLDSDWGKGDMFGYYDPVLWNTELGCFLDQAADITMKDFSVRTRKGQKIKQQMKCIN